MIFSAVDFPDPLAPRMILVWPLISVKLTIPEHDLVVERELHVIEHDHRRSGLGENLLRPCWRS